MKLIKKYFRNLDYLNREWLEKLILFLNIVIKIITNTD